MRDHVPGFGDHGGTLREELKTMAEKVLMKGNEALAEAAIQAGCHHFFGYPITPQTELLDVGTGSGILAIVALMYGAGHAVGTDLDPCATEAVRENMEMNGIDPAKFEMMIGNIITEKEIQDRVGYGKYDIVAANILAEVLVPLMPVVAKCLKPGGTVITSGIINGKEGLVADAKPPVLPSLRSPGKESGCNVLHL